MKIFLQSFCFAFFALLCSTQTKAQCTTEGSSLATTNSGGHIHGSGIMFNITAKKNLTITCFDIALAHTGVCEIYYRQGPFQGYENSSASWIKAGEVSGLTALGGLTPIPIDVYVHIPAGQTYGFYINRELEGGVAGTVYRPSETSNSTIATNSDLDITGGIAKSALFGEGINSPNSAVYGRVHYLEGFALPCNTATGQDFTFNTQQQINDFATNYAHCTNITLNNLVIGYATNDGFSNITDLTPLQNITGITGELIIRRNPQLTTLNGLQNITSFNGNLRIEGNDLLTSISALSNITSVGFLNIRDNAVLASLNGLHNLTSTSGYLYIRSNAQLTNLDAFQSLTSIGTYIEVFDNPVLQNLNGLQNVTAINGNIIINSNPALTDISGLRNINPATITGPTGLRITDNPQLSVCNLPNFCTYLSGSGARTISGNKTTCLNVSAVTNACQVNCPTQSFAFHTQAQIDEFGALYAHCTNITLSNVLIGYGDPMANTTDITDLTPLQNITTLTGYLLIRNNPYLTNVNGLSALTSIGGYLLIQNNNALTDVNGLSALTSIGRYLSFHNNSALTNLNGLNNLTSIPQYLNLFDNPLLTNIAGLSSITTIGGSVVINNTGITNLNGLQSLTSIGQHLDIRNNPMLTNLDALSSLSSINGYLALISNPLLTGISGLQNVNPSGIGRGYGLYIENNSQLSVCNLPNFCTYLAGSGARTINGNKTTCLNVSAVQATCTCPTGNWTFNTQAQIDEFGALYGYCTDITLGSVVIGYFSGGSTSDITDLTPLQNITGTTGYLYIRNNPNLTNVNGLSALQSIGGSLYIWNNPALTDVNGLSALTSIGGFLYIKENNALTNVNGLSALTSIGGYLTIQNNPALTDVNGLSALTSIGGFLDIYNNNALTNVNGLSALQSIGGSLYFLQNNALTNVNGLSALTGIGGYLNIESNPALTNVNGLSALTSIGGSLRILSNAVLTDISGLANINPATITGNGLQITDNPQLAVCNLPNFCTYLSGSGARTISGNKATCLNVTAIQATCTCPTGDYTFNTQAQIDEFGALYGYCSDITLGNVVIGYATGASTSDITDLTPLQNITAVTGYLRIRSNPNLTDVNGLSALTSIGGYFDIYDNNALTDVNGLSALQSIGGDLYIRQNSVLTDVNGLSALTSIGGYLYIKSNNALTNLNGLSALTSIGGGLYIRENNALTDISGLANINPATITGTIGLRITDNPQLAVCNLPNFCTYLQGSGARTISGNAGDCISVQAVTNACFWSNITPDDDNILYVNHNVSGSTQSGNSWANAIPQLAVALKWAKQKYDADNTVFDAVPLKIYVATGTYKPLYRADNLDGSNPQDRDNAFVMVKNVQIFGGFAGNETTLEERNYATNPTILSGDIDGTNGLSANDVYHVMVSVGNVGSALLDGFTVSGGYITSADGNTGITVNGSLVRYERGSGLSLTASSPQIRNVLFTGHRTYAGVVSHSTGSNATFVNTLFTGNTSQYGAVYNNVSSPVFINSTFSGNTGTDNANNGVAMRNITSHPKFYNTIVWGNQNANGSTNNIFNSGGGNPTSIPEYYHSLVQGITTTDNGNLNGSTNPLFTDAVNGDFSLQTGSTAITKGNNSYFSGLTIDAKDLAGNPRVYNHANNGTIDMGAYEYQELLPQSITFNALQGRSVGDADFDLTATASSNLPVTYTSSNPSVAVVIGNTVSIKNSGNTNIIASQSGNGDYAAATAVSQVLQITGTLPVTLLNFTAKADGNHAKLQWETANEKNAKGFEVYRSGDDKAFVKIGDVRTSLNVPLSTFNYTYTDQQPLNGNNYYKLVQIDDDGKSIDLGERAVTFNFQPTPVNLYPNPTTDKVNVVFKEGYYTAIIVADVNGGVLKVLEIQADQKQLELDLSSYASGVYLIRLQGKETKTYRVIKY
ncbi:leucine-rich repeat protein [Pseudopedobacter beijingensis]|uniref:Leucine-rich repeat protein n=1 Tax=Pseudopedobacter beijingensis TaxID=1207056 RepID=A0ABW4IBS5_9SPHI